jgi:hypothetical protein
MAARSRGHRCRSRPPNRSVNFPQRHGDLHATREQYAGIEYAGLPVGDAGSDQVNQAVVLGPSLVNNEQVIDCSVHRGRIASAASSKSTGPPQHDAPDTAIRSQSQTA